MDNSSQISARKHEASPRIWLIIGDKIGDNAQVELIANSLALPYATKHLYPREMFLLGKPRFRASLEHLDPERSDLLSPLWPDLIITAGRRHSMAALWIKAQSPATKIVLPGRPRRWIDRFDLVISPPQHRVPDLPQVMRLSLPLMRADANSVSISTLEWASRLEAFQKPIIAVLIGNATRPFRFDAEVTGDLLAECARVQEHYGGTLYFSTSRRTSSEIIITLGTQLPEGAQLYEWRPDDTGNPYLALLEHANYFIVTGDSIAMMIEVVDRKKPLAIFQLPGFWRGRAWQSITLALHAEAEAEDSMKNRVLRWVGRLLYKTGIAGFSRDLTRVHKTLVSGGFAVYLGQPFRTTTLALPDELERIRTRIPGMIPPP